MSTKYALETRNADELLLVPPHYFGKYRMLALVFPDELYVLNSYTFLCICSISAHSPVLSVCPFSFWLEEFRMEADACKW
jgi:hypothetical protein